MANHDFWCQVCGQVLVDVNVPIAVGATAGAPEHCGRKMAWMPAVGRMDAGSGPTFQAFETHDGQNQPVTIDSLKKLRDLERTSEQQYRNGEGQPLVFRRWSQSSSNRDVHTIDPARFTAGERPDPAYVKKFGLKRLGAEEPDHSYGPGVSDANTSALDHLSPSPKEP